MLKEAAEGWERQGNTGSCQKKNAAESCAGGKKQARPVCRERNGEEGEGERDGKQES